MKTLSQPTETKSTKHTTRRSPIDSAKELLRGREPELCEAIGIDFEELTSGNKTECPACRVKKLRVSNVATGAGGCDGCEDTWGDWIGFAAKVRGLSSFAAATEINRILGNEPQPARRNPKRKLEPQRIPPKNDNAATSPAADDATDADTGPMSEQEVEVRHRVNASLLAAVQLRDEHREDLRRRGLDNDAISHAGYASWLPLTRPITMEGIDDLSVSDLASVPGWRPDGRGFSDATKHVGYLVPVRDHNRRIVALQIRLDRPIKKTRYISFSSNSPSKGIDGPSPGTPAHCTVGVVAGCESLRITEGPLKADVSEHLSGIPAIGVLGVGTWRHAIPIVNKIRPGRVLVAYDADAAKKRDVANHLRNLVKELQANDVNVAIETWDAADGKGIDDLLAAGGTPTVLSEAGEIKKYLAGLAGGDDRAVIEWTDNEKTVVELTIDALGGSPEMFCRGSVLCDVTEAAHPLDIDRVAVQIRDTPAAHLRTIITDRARYVVTRETGEGPSESPKKITQELVKQVAAYGKYRGVRELHGVSEYPFLRHDGTVCVEGGYDPATKTYLRCELDISMPEHPTKVDAAAAADRILDLVRDFEFAEECHRMAWLAGLLTVFAKPAIRGNVPFFIFEASTQGSGKTRLVDLIGTIATGSEMPRNPWPSRDDEVSKQITSIVLSGIPLVLFDNVRTRLGGQSLEALGTATTWKGRILGESRESGSLLVRQVFFFTGNNCEMTLDIARRGCFARIEPSTENPDMREGFKYPDLLGHAKQNRRQIIADVLTILVAFRRSGESPSIRPWGSYETWSDAIRKPIAWLGLADPYDGTVTAKESATSGDIFPELLEGLIDANLTNAFACEILNAATQQNGYGEFVRPGLRDTLLDAVGDKPLTTIRIGKALERYDGKIFDGKKLFSNMDRKKKKIWRIVPAERRECRELPGVVEPLEVFSDEGSEKGGTDINTTATPELPATPGTPGKCQPRCSDDDLLESEERSGMLKTECRRCGKFFGRRPRV